MYIIAAGSVRAGVCTLRGGNSDTADFDPSRGCRASPWRRLRRVGAGPRRRRFTDWIRAATERALSRLIAAELATGTLCENIANTYIHTGVNKYIFLVQISLLATIFGHDFFNISLNFFDVLLRFLKLFLTDILEVLYFLFYIYFFLDLYLLKCVYRKDIITHYKLCTSERNLIFVGNLKSYLPKTRAEACGGISSKVSNSKSSYLQLFHE